MVQSTKNHVNCTRRVKLFLKKVQAVQLDRNEAWLKHEIMKDIEQWDPRFDVEVFNEKGYFTILKRLSLNDLKHYRKYIKPGLKKLTQTETDYLASGQEKTLMARVLDVLHDVREDIIQIQDDMIQTREAWREKKDHLVISRHINTLKRVFFRPLLQRQHRQQLETEICSLTDAFNSTSPPPSKDERKKVRRTKSATDLTHSSTAFTTITSMQGGARPTTPLPGMIESLSNHSPPFTETAKSSTYVQRLSPPNCEEQIEKKRLAGLDDPVGINDPELYVISIFKLYQDTWKHVIGVFKKNIPALPLGASEVPRTEHVFAWCLHNIKKLNGPKVRAAEDYDIYLYYQLLLVLTSTMADDLSDAVCPPEIGALLSKPILKHWPKQSISIQSHHTIKNELEWKLLEHYVKNSPPSIELIKDMISQKIPAVQVMDDEQDKQEIIDELETYFSQLLEEETVPVEDDIKDLAREILVQTLKQIDPELPAKIQKTSTELLKLIQLSRGAMATYFNQYIQPILSNGSNFRASDGKRSPQGNSKSSDKSQDFDRLVEEIDKKMVTGYGHASLNSADLRQAISEAVYNPSQVQEVKYIAEDGEVFIDNMMVVVFLDVMNHLAPEGSIYAKTAGFFDLLKKMPRYANDIATARRELFKDGDYSAEQIRQTLLDETPLKKGQTLMYRRVSETLQNLTSEELGLKTDPQSKLDFLLLLNQIKTILIELKLENPFNKEKYADISELHDEVCDYVYSELIQSHEKDIISEWLDNYDDLESELNKIHRRQKRANSRDRSMRSMEGENKNEEIHESKHSQALIFLLYLFSGGKQ